jgi:Ca2+-binding RTX toxin-like protein
MATNNSIKVGTSADNIIGADPTGSTIYGLGGNDTLKGGGGNDTLIGGEGADKLSGGGGFADLADYSDSPSGIIAVMGGGSIGGSSFGGTAEGDTIASDIEAIGGSEFDDFIFGNNLDNMLFGNGGKDFLQAEGGDDYLDGGDGNDIMIGGAGADTFHGGSGKDTVSYEGNPDPLFGVSVRIGVADIDHISRGDGKGDYVDNTVENLIGSRNDDSLEGNSQDNRLDSGDGDDAISGNGGNDELIGGKGHDSIFGDADIDTVIYTASNAGVNVDLRGRAADYIGTMNRGTGGDAEGDNLFDIENFEGSKFGDTVIGSKERNTLSGNDGDDSLLGGGERDTLLGGNGNDTLFGETGDDSLYGNAGADTLFGGSNKDRLSGGDGNDKLDGGSEADTFVFAFDTLGDTDIIKDFNRSEGDIISLINMDANANAGGNQDFSFIGQNAFSGVAGQLHYNSNGFETVLTGDVNGDKLADFTIKLTDAPGLIASDFLL